MPHMMHVESAAREFSIALTLAFVVSVLVYVRGWISSRSSRLNAIQNWRAASFLFGSFLIWVVVASPLGPVGMDLLTVHMVHHLSLMTIAAPLIWLGEPVKALRCGLPDTFVNSFIRRMLRTPLLRWFGGVLARPTVSWCAATATLVGWHIPAVFTLAMQSEAWHAFEYASFVASGLLFWWPVVRPWPIQSTSAGWPTIVYLFLATLPCDILSGFLVFSERVAYPVYLSMPRHSGLTVLEDQQFAGALMWTVVTIVYFVAAVIVSMQLLSPGRDQRALGLV